MTAQASRDALAEMDGWNAYNEGVPDDGACHISWWRYTLDAVHGGRTWCKNHPHAPTLDGADAAVPEGWTWSRSRYSWFGEHDDRVEMIQVPDTGDKIADLYALALACRKAMEERK